MKQIVQCILLVSLMASCAVNVEERQQVGAMMDRLDVAKARFEALVPDSLPMTAMDIDQRLSVITRGFPEQLAEIEIEKGNMLADYKAIKKVFKGLAAKRGALAAQIDTSIVKLRALDRDLDANKVPEELKAKFLADEEQALTAIVGSIDALDTLFARGARGFERLTPQVDELINEFRLARERNEN